jgi:hypothetical protein
MIFIEDKFLFDEKEKEYIDELIINNYFPYYYQSTAVDDDHYPFLCHTLKFTDKDANHSSQTEKFIEILDKFCKKHEIYYDTVYRVAINLTFNNGYKHSKIHCDHKFEHKQLIIYLNEPKDKESQTIIVDNNKEIKVVPEKYKAICFGRVPHYHYTPRFGERVVAVFTFGTGLQKSDRHNGHLIPELI